MSLYMSEAHSLKVKSLHVLPDNIFQLHGYFAVG